MATRKPNILWICTDQQRFDTLSAVGNTHVHTPNLDRLAREGVLFENAFAQNSVCTPSRASFLTGRYPRTTRCRQNGQGIPADEVLVTKMFPDAGYECGLAGNLHLNPFHPGVVGNAGERRVDDGYDVFHWHHDHWPWSAYGEGVDAQGEEREFNKLEACPHVEVGPAASATPTAWAAAMAADFMRQRADSNEPWLF